MNANSESNCYLTERGVSNPLKNALLARFPLVQKCFNQASFIESLQLTPQVLADIWLPASFPPVSLEPLNEEEARVATTGQFGSVGRNVGGGAGGGNANRGNQAHDSGSGRNYSDRRNSNYQNRNSGRSGSGPSATAASSRGGFSKFQRNQSNEDSETFFRKQQRFPADYENGEAIEDPDSLWATPSADTFGSSDFGSFDENGIFRSGQESSLPPLRPEDFGFKAKNPSNAPVSAPAPVAPVAPVAPAAATVAIPHITPDTQWLYRDPSGQIQGPFPSHRMLEWYSGNYFPENLPLRREQDPFFEPLSTWKTKCAGQVPFAAYSTKPPAPSSTATSALSPRVTFDSALLTSASSTVAPVANAASTGSGTTRSVPLESLFGVAFGRKAGESVEVSLASAIESLTVSSVVDVVPPEKPGSPDVLMPGARHPTTTVPRFGQVAAEDVAANKASVGWASPSTPMKKISLADIMQNEHKSSETAETDAAAAFVTAPANVISSANVTAAAVQSGTGGWAKINVSPVQPLSVIQAEQARKDAEAKRASASSASASSSAAPKSFADLVRSAGVSGGNIVVTASSASEAIPINKAASATPSATKPAPVPKEVTPVPKAASQPSLGEWCVSSLSNTALAKVIDPATCTSLLMDLPSPAAIFAFALETLQPMLSESSAATFDLAGFARELATRKFGKPAAEKVNWSRLTSFSLASTASSTSFLASSLHHSQPLASKPTDFAFETVKRKK